MRIMIDANIIISAGLFPESIVGKVLMHIVKYHRLVLCEYTKDELNKVFKKKFSKRTEHLNNFINELKYELIDIKIKDYRKYPQLRDINDIPLLANAIEANVDLLITGDKDFYDIEIEKPKIINPRKYFDEYIIFKVKNKSNN